MKLSAALALAAVGGTSAYSVNRSTLRSLGQKNVAARSQRNVRTNDIKMEGELIIRLKMLVLTCGIIKFLISLHVSIKNIKTSDFSRDLELVSKMPGVVLIFPMQSSLRLVSRRHLTRMVFVTR